MSFIEGFLKNRTISFSDSQVLVGNVNFKYQTAAIFCFVDEDPDLQKT